MNGGVVVNVREADYNVSVLKYESNGLQFDG